MTPSITIPQPLPKSEVCVKCHQGPMRKITQEHVLIQNCPCGYECKTITGDSKATYKIARGVQ